MSHNTSAQGAPVTSQEAEAREAVLKAYDESGSSPTFETDEAYDAAFFAALDAYAAVIRASERERYAELVKDASRRVEVAIQWLEVEAARQRAWKLPENVAGLELGIRDMREGFAAALAALEEAGSA